MVRHRWMLFYALAMTTPCLAVEAGPQDPPQGPPDEQYFLLMFGSQRPDPEPEYSHTWATFVKVTWLGPSRSEPRLEPFTISWFPADLDIRLIRFRPQPGANFSLHTTLRHVLGTGQRVSMWGPYEIDRELFTKAQEQLARLESGKVRYKAIDLGRLCDKVNNCIHGVSSTLGGPRPHVFIPAWGETASFVVLLRFSPWIIDRRREHYWISSALGLDIYPIIYRKFRNPWTGTYSGALGRILGSHDNRNVPTYGPPRQ